jgi:hypothetical protein
MRCSDKEVDDGHDRGNEAEQAGSTKYPRKMVAGDLFLFFHFQFLLVCPPGKTSPVISPSPKERENSQN